MTSWDRPLYKYTVSLMWRYRSWWWSVHTDSMHRYAEHKRPTTREKESEVVCLWNSKSENSFLDTLVHFKTWVLKFATMTRSSATRWCASFFSHREEKNESIDSFKELSSHTPTHTHHHNRASLLLSPRVRVTSEPCIVLLFCDSIRFLRQQ